MKHIEVNLSARNKQTWFVQWDEPAAQLVGQLEASGRHVAADDNRGLSIALMSFMLNSTKDAEYMILDDGGAAISVKRDEVTSIEVSVTDA